MWLIKILQYYLFPLTFFPWLKWAHFYLADAFGEVVEWRKYYQCFYVFLSYFPHSYLHPHYLLHPLLPLPPPHHHLLLLDHNQNH
ncbi:ORF1238 [White spot syndrome virus]|uniref:ORF1238 n=1 Tax=White spot syndrome virus TaxID=342409 RepID=A0A2D3I5X5_9VIRU|nr:ORF1238 [White spot syndrome virus]